MNKPEHVFDPELIMPFNPGITDGKPLQCRDLFYQLNQSANKQPIIAAAYALVAEGLKQAEQTYSALISTDYGVEKLLSLRLPIIAGLPGHLSTKENQLKCIEQMSAIQLTQPCWLQNITLISCSNTKLAMQLSSIYLQLTQNRGGQSALNDLYRTLLLAEGVKIPVLHHFSYSRHPGIISEAFSFAATQCAISQFPRVFFAEILGFTLAYIQSPTLVEVCYPKHQLSADYFAQRHQVLDRQLNALIACITDYLALFPQNHQALWQRIQHGFWLYQLQMQRCRDHFKQQIEQSLSPAQAVAEIFQQKAVSAIGHHHNIMLQGLSLDHWFSAMPDNSQKFLQALTQSDYVNANNPMESRLLKLFNFKGPMFGVFDKSEISVIENWLVDGENNKPLERKLLAKASTNTVIQKPDSQSRKYTKLSNRALYYYLLNADLFPDILATAQVKTSKLLQLTALFNPLPFKHYSHQQFDSHIETIYQAEMNAYQPLKGKPNISRAAYLWGIEQIAPMILIDGCWLQNCQSVQRSYPEVSEILFSIYCDETGNGQLQQNHSHIFQQLLDSLSITVPPVYSKAFTKHSGFINSAFDLPAYMLALSIHSERFLAELLGLNMAIELSGLGKSYMQLVDEWHYWQIDTTIASIHISIDNYSSGHTFLAKKAIQLYLDEILKRTGDVEIMNRHWQRIYNGYASLRFVGARFKLSLPVYYLLKKFVDK